MSQIRIDTKKALNKWSPVLENLGVSGEKLEWMSEYAEYHSINENAYVNANIDGMGGVLSPQPSVLSGQTSPFGYSTGNYGVQGSMGSGDVGQNLLPVAMKIAAQTIGLDLVAVKPSPGPKLDLLFIDFRYDDARSFDESQRPQVFKIDAGTAKADVKTALDAILGTEGIKETTDGLKGGRVFLKDIGLTNSTCGELTTTEPADKLGVLEFLGYSRIDGLPMFRAYRQANITGFTFEVAKNTFPQAAAITNYIKCLAGEVLEDEVKLELISTFEDHLPGFSANWNSAANTAAGSYPMDREMDDKRYSGVIGPKISSKSIAIGTIEVSSTLRRTEIEDIKANTGMDIVQKMESVLVNELSQTISKQIVHKIFEMGDLNRESAPKRGSDPIFDFDTSYAAAAALGGETTHAVQRKLITRINHASNFIATEGRVGPAQYLVTNGGLAAALSDISGYTLNPVKSKMNAAGQLYPTGTIGDIAIYVDPYMKYNDNRIVLGRKNAPDQPGIIFVPYLMAQSITVISEATFAPRMLLRSRFAIAEVGWFPQKQFMTINVKDEEGLLN
jgi:hypothetical protein